MDKGLWLILIGCFLLDIVLLDVDYSNGEVIVEIINRDLVVGLDVFFVFGISLCVFGLKKLVSMFVCVVD